ncbi:MAG: hypothetical protein JSS75_02610 [Bacteroidetes bacterium]|nr:hypothetical protein [Bacteroidota bacterium]
MKTKLYFTLVVVLALVALHRTSFGQSNVCGTNTGDFGETTLTTDYCWIWNCILGTYSVPNPPPTPGIYLGITTCSKQAVPCTLRPNGTICPVPSNSYHYFSLRNNTGCLADCGPYGHAPAVVQVDLEVQIAQNGPFGGNVVVCNVMKNFGVSPWNNDSWGIKAWNFALSRWDTTFYGVCNGRGGGSDYCSYDASGNLICRFRLIALPTCTTCSTPTYWEIPPLAHLTWEMDGIQAVNSATVYYIWDSNGDPDWNGKEPGGLIPTPFKTVSATFNNPTITTNMVGGMDYSTTPPTATCGGPCQ